MYKSIRAGLTLLTTFMICFVIGAAPLPGAVFESPTLRPDLVLPTVVTDQIIVPDDETKIIINPNLKPKVDLNLNMFDLVLQYPQGGEIIKYNQLFIIEFNLKEIPKKLAVYANTGVNGEWEEVSLLLGLGSNHEGNYTFFTPYRGSYFKNTGMPNNTAKIKVVADWYGDGTDVAERISKGFTVLGEKSGSVWNSQLKAVPGNNKVALSWEPVGATSKSVSYIVTRRTVDQGTNGDWNTLTDFPVNETAYTDNTAKNLTKYEYRVWVNVLDAGKYGFMYDNATVTPANCLVFVVGSNVIKLNGANIQIDSPPVITDGRTFVPIRALIEHIGGNIAYNPNSQEITLRYKDKTLIMMIGNNQATLNGAPVNIDVPPYISAEGRTMIPLRFVSDSLGLTTSWDVATQSITIKF